MTERSTKLMLGSVQWGVDYGIERRPKVVQSEVARILRLARQSDITMIDTSPAYGEVEALLGDMLFDDEFEVVTKLQKVVDKNARDDYLPEMMVKKILESLSRLQRKKIYGLLLHDVDDIWNKGFAAVVEGLEQLKNLGLVSKIGLSVYSPSDVKRALEFFIPDIVQLPINAIDQRFESSGVLHLLQGLGVEVHARSVFLQGLLLGSCIPETPRFNALRELQDRFLLECARQHLKPVAASLSSVIDNPLVDKVIIGVDSLDQLLACVSALEHCSVFDASGLESEDLNLVDPRYWYSQ